MIVVQLEQTPSRTGKVRKETAIKTMSLHIGKPIKSGLLHQSRCLFFRYCHQGKDAILLFQRQNFAGKKKRKDRTMKESVSYEDVNLQVYSILDTIRRLAAGLQSDCCFTSDYESAVNDKTDIEGEDLSIEKKAYWWVNDNYDKIRTVLDSICLLSEFAIDSYDAAE